MVAASDRAQHPGTQLLDWTGDSCKAEITYLRFISAAGGQFLALEDNSSQKNTWCCLLFRVQCNWKRKRCHF